MALEEEAEEGDVPAACVARWLPHRVPKPGVVLRVWCVHWAGACASAFGGWEERFGEGVELCALQLPGRETRKEEEPPADVRATARQALHDLRPLFEESRSLLFGHGSGSWVCYELALALRDAGMPPPVLLIASGFPSPDTPVQLRPWKPAADLEDDAALAEELRGWGLPELLMSQKTYWARFAPHMRKELAFADAYECAEDVPPLNCPVACFVSQDDPKFGPKSGTPTLMDGWGRLSTTLQCKVDVFFGDHYYLQDEKLSRLVAKLVAERAQAYADLIDLDW